MRAQLRLRRRLLLLLGVIFAVAGQADASVARRSDGCVVERPDGRCAMCIQPWFLLYESDACVDACPAGTSSHEDAVSGLRLCVPSLQGCPKQAWANMTRMPTPVGEVAVGLFPDLRLLFVAGEAELAVLNVTYVYNLTARLWSTAAPRPHVGNHHGSVVIGRQWILVGGLGGTSPGTVQVYNVDLGTWSLGPPLPWPGGSVNAVAINGTVFACSGLQTVGSVTTNSRSCAKWTPGESNGGWVSFANIPVGVNHAAAGTDGRQMYVFGGRTNNCNCVANGINSLQIYDPQANAWQLIDNPTGPDGLTLLNRGGMGSAPFLDGRLYVFGGETKHSPVQPEAAASGVFRTVHAYDPVAGRFYDALNMPVALHGVFPVSDPVRNAIYVIGGGTRAGQSKSSLAFVLLSQPPTSTET